ncbi:hypothetical protein EZS27_013608 [termite gut metagenome]|uniref:HU domain-containing protein n=1 Tax=termite gut metagenome TaxID=433724 RepID=A0A5J4RZF8_9ZZZZ
MTLLYKAFQSNLKSKDGEQKWFPRLAKVGKTIDTQDLAEMIARESSLTIGDVHNAIRNLIEVMKQELLNSHSVRLDSLGTFTVISHSRGKGVSSFDLVNHTQIAQLLVRFTPVSTYNHIDGTTRSIFTGVEFERVDKKNTPQPLPSDVSVTAVTLNGASIAQGSGSLSIDSGKVMVISGTGLTNTSLKVRILTDPFGEAVIVALASIGTVTTDAPGTSLTVNITTSGAVFSLLKSADNTVVYSFVP